MKGEFVHVQHDSKLNRYSIEGSGTVIGSCALDCDTATWEVKLGKNPSGLMSYFSDIIIIYSII